MSDSGSNPSLSQLSAKLDDLVFGIKLLFAVALVVISIPNFIASLCIPRFALIFHDALPGKSLPALTMVVLANPFWLKALTIIWPLLGVSILIFSHRIRLWVITSSLIACAIGAQLFLTQTALFTPMVELITGFSGPPQ